MRVRSAACAAILTATLLSPASGAAASPIGGTRCDVPGASVRANNARFICSPEGGRSVWRRILEPSDVGAVLIGVRGFSIFVAALGLTDMSAQLRGPGPWTVFAPTNSAFHALGRPVLDKLLLPENRPILQAILRHHLVQTRITARTMAAGDLAVLDGTTVRVQLRGGIVVDDSRIVLADLGATNGVVHGVNKVLLPSWFNPDDL